VAKAETQRPRLSPLAEMIELDIRRRGLTPGDAYLTAEEVGRQFGANSRTASRAMSQLADVNKLVRRRGAGTFVGPEFQKGQSPSAGTIYVLISTGRLLTGLPIDQVIVELSQRIRDCQVRVAVLPTADERDFVKRLLAAGADGEPIVGLVLIGCPSVVHEAVSASGVAAVVFGSSHANGRRLPSADADHRTLGELATQYLIERGCGRVAVILRDRWLPGDNLFLDGVNAALAEASAKHGSPIVRSLPAEADAIAAEVARLLDDDDHPNGLICRGRLFAESALRSIADSGLEVGADIEVIANLDAADQIGSLPIAVVTAEADYREQIRIIAMLLRDQMEGVNHDNEHQVLPVRLVEGTTSTAMTAP